MPYLRYSALTTVRNYAEMEEGLVAFNLEIQDRTSSNPSFVIVPEKDEKILRLVWLHAMANASMEKERETVRIAANRSVKVKIKAVVSKRRREPIGAGAKRRPATVVELPEEGEQE